MEFLIGEVVVSPSHGVGRIDSIVKHDGKDGLKVLIESGETIFIPLATAALALRKPVSAAKGKELLAILKNSSLASSNPSEKWEDIINKLDPEPAAKMLRLLYNRSPHFSMLERRLICTLENVLISEIASACGVNRTELEVELKAQRDIRMPKP